MEVSFQAETNASARQSTPKIVSKDANCWYGDHHVLKNINMEVMPNTVTALIGPSGCGKSTYIRVFNRMNDLIEVFRFQGDITIDEKDIYDKNTPVNELRKNVGMVFQKPNPFPKSIFENVAYGLRVNGVNDKKTLTEAVEHSLRQSALWDEVKDNLQKNALGLSGGQQQRLCIARAIAVEPSIILMDEPTSALDPISNAKIEDLIYELKQKYTILIVTHNMQQAARVSDKTAFFYLGDLVEFAETRQMFTNPKEEMTQRYITGRFG